MLQIEVFLEGRLSCPLCKVENNYTTYPGEKMFAMTTGCVFCGGTLTRRGAPIPEEFFRTTRERKSFFCFCNMHHGQRQPLDGMEVVE